jgi:hypothetical protein
MAGRPSDYTPDLAAKILSRIADGESVRSICRDEAMPASSTIFLWLQKHSEFTEQYARASEARADALFEEALEIADDGSQDYKLVDRDGKETEVFDSEHVQRSKLRVDTRKWMIGKMQPKKYGEKVLQEISGPSGGPVETVTRIELVPMTGNAGSQG